MNQNAWENTHIELLFRFKVTFICWLTNHYFQPKLTPLPFEGPFISLVDLQCWHPDGGQHYLDGLWLLLNLTFYVIIKSQLIVSWLTTHNYDNTFQLSSTEDKSSNGHTSSSNSISTELNCVAFVLGSLIF